MNELQSVFGPLRKNGREWRVDETFTLFGRPFELEIIVEGNDMNATVFTEQTETMAYFKEKQWEVFSVVEKAIVGHYQSVVNPGDPIDSRSMSNKVELTGIVFPLVVDRGERVFGFLLECDWDQENGLAVRFEGDSVQVGSQDLLT